jgi:hypothetical protein
MAVGRDYHFIGPDGSEVCCSIADLAYRHQLSYQSIKRLAGGRQRQHQGWRCADPLRTSAATYSRGEVILYEWEHSAVGRYVGTAGELAERAGISRSGLYQLVRRQSARLRGWRVVAEMARWTVRRLDLQYRTGLKVRLTPLELYRNEGFSMDEVDDLLAGEEVRFLRLITSEQTEDQSHAAGT